MQIQDAILKAIEAMTQTSIDKLQLDKTIIAEILTCTNALNKEYKCSYNGGFITAYATDEANYTNGQSVYILVPQNDFTKRKVIVGLSSAQENDGNISFVSSALSDYNLIGKNIITDKHKLQPVGLHSYKHEEYYLLYDYSTKDQNTYLGVEIEELNNNLRQAEVLMIEASFQTRLPKQHRLSQNGIYGLQFVLAFKDRDKTDANGNSEIKYIPYVIDSNSMTGNPLRFSSWSEQYQIFPIDIENFLYIDSILFYEKDFVEEDNATQIELWGADIFLKDIEVYPLKKIDATSGNYKLSISMPQGSTFRDITSEDQLDIVAKVTEKNTTNLSDNTTFYWFKEDNKVTSDKDDYQMYGGAGWAWLKDKGNNYMFYTAGNENRAYENNYLCVAVYKESVILKTYFTLYNEAARRDISINSSLGVKFSFDRGKPVLTCLIDGKSENFEKDKPYGHDDNLFSFVWAKIDEYNNVTTFLETYEDLEKRYEELINAGNVSYHDLTALKTQMQMIKNVTWNRNILEYPINQIDSTARFKCSVYLKDTPDGEEYSIGAAEILLQNESVASPSDYYIIIENGDQVFQYSESGVAPNSERYTDPLEIKPLSCHFFDPAGLEVNKDTYDVKWVVPLDNSMIVVPTQNMIVNNANNRIEWYTEEIYPLEIKDTYDYQALNNQLTAIITYQNQEYQQDTDLLFTKIGENGTNGTDIVTKISPALTMNNNELLAIIVNGDNTYYNDILKTPLSSATAPLQFDIYNRNIEIVLDSQKDKLTWDISGAAKESKYLAINDILSSRLTWNKEDITKKYRYQIIKATAVYEDNQYYAFYPMPVIEYNNVNNLEVTLDKIKTIKSVTYNADGRNPLYNKNQGIELNIKGGPQEDYYIVWYAEGGEPDVIAKQFSKNPHNAAFKLLLNQTDKKGYTEIIPETNGYNSVYILPNDIYSGEYTNNIVHAAIYTNKQVFENNGNTICDVYIPIHFALNVYGLKSLNAWDGNHVEINEDENYVLAPQIGAGEKDNENKFTGILMGTSKTYDQSESQIGLLGYSHGKQSIWLDAETGNAIFGLPEQQATQENKFTEGRIELIPGGESKIGQWRVGSRAMYNMTVPDPEGDTYTGVEPIGAYKDHPVHNAQIAVPQEAQGIILNANPAYASFKGRPLYSYNSNINFDDANVAIREGDSFEVEIDPSKESAFSIYRHTKWDKDEYTDEWHRYPLVGINAQGQFYTNAIENEESSMGIGKIGAFGSIAADGKYIGAQFGYDNTNLFKFFINPTEDTDINPDDKDNVVDNTLYLSAGTKASNEYSRPLSMNFKEINLYASSSNSSSYTTNYSINLSSSGITLGQKDKNYLNLMFTNNSNAYSSLTLENNLSIIVPKNRHIVLNNPYNALPLVDISQGTIQIELSGNLNANTQGQIALDSQTKAHLGSKYFDFSLDWAAGKAQLASDNNCYLLINRDTGTNSTWVDNYGITLDAKQNGGIQIISENSNHGIKLDARISNNSQDKNTYLTLLPENQGFSTFYLSSGCGTIRSAKGELLGNNNGILLSPFAVSWANFTGARPGTSRSIEAANQIWGQEFYFNNNKTGHYNGGNYTSQSIWDHLNTIYNLLQQTRDYANTRANQAEQNAKNYATSYANNNFVTNSRYNGHTHLVSMDDTQIFYAAEKSGGSTTKRINIISATASTIGTSAPH